MAGEAKKGEAVSTPVDPAASGVSRSEFDALSQRLDKLCSAVERGLSSLQAPIAAAAPVELKVVRPSRLDEARRAQRELDRRTAQRDLDTATRQLQMAAGASRWVIAVVQPKERGRVMVVNPADICGGASRPEAELKYREFHGITAVSQPSMLFVGVLDDIKNPVPSDLLEQAQKRLSDAKRLQEEAAKSLERCKAEVA